MNKICTSLEQSKKLIELGVDINTADMYFNVYQDLCFPIGDFKIDWNFIQNDEAIPAWSLAALLNVLPYPSLHRTFMGWRCDSYNKEGTSCIFGETSNNQVDACYEMILKLHELKLL